MKVVVKKPLQEAEVKEIGEELENLQEIVGGYIECVNITDDILCVCNEEGKLEGLTPNFILGGDVVVGDVFFCSLNDEGDFISLNDEQIELVMTAMHLLGLVKSE